MDMKQFLRSIELRKDKAIDFSKYPFTIPSIKGLTKLNFHKHVTFLVGENGTGKSTLLEAIAVSYGFNPEGGSRNFNFETYGSHSDLYQYIAIAKGAKLPKDGYFLRAESYFNVASEIERLDAIPAASALIKEAYGGNLHERSHGESFYALLLNRLRGDGLYIFDEPEAALSPMRQMEMLHIIDKLVKDGSQFIIATHSPIILAYPSSSIFLLSESGIEKTEYEQTEHFRKTKFFLNNYEDMVKGLGENK